MSQVENAISGERDNEQTLATTATATAPTAIAIPPTIVKNSLIKDSTLKQKNQQQQQQQHHQYYNNKSTTGTINHQRYYTKVSSGSAANLTHHHHHHHNHHHNHHPPPLAPPPSSHHQKQQHHHFHTEETPLTTHDEQSDGGGVGAAPVSSVHRRCLGRSLKILFSTPGLVLLVCVYSVLGALIFPLLEAPQDITKSAAIAKSREDCLRELWIITEKLNVLYERNWTMLVHEQLRRFEGSIVAATRNTGAGSSGGGASGGRFFGGESADSVSGSGTALARFGGTFGALEPRWSFSEALLYSVTVITTIGHGSLTPRTSAGKIATIAYALIGVPLMLMCLSSLGALLAEALQCTYARVCCRLVGRHRHGSGRHRAGDDDDGDEGHKNRCRRGRDSGAGGSFDDGDDDVCREVADGGGGGSSRCKSQTIDCKGCKYDAIVGDRSLQSADYDYGSPSRRLVTKATTDNDDCCQLLHNSPVKVNQNTSCMQLKMAATAAATATMATNAQYYQRLMQQQQHQRQSALASDAAMTGSITSSPSGSAVVGQKLSQESAQPLQAYHIVCSTPSTASANSSPTHHHSNASAMATATAPSAAMPPASMQQYTTATLLPSPHRQQQHFVAVPSSMVRFQAAAAGNSGNGSNNCGSGPMGQCYQSASVGGGGGVGGGGNNDGATTTIFFPIAATAATVAPRPPGCSTMLTQLLCHQPLVKYHTIQLQHKQPSDVGGAGQQQQQQQQKLMDTITPNAVAFSSSSPPPPPPPAYQTATVHGVRRARLVAPEINTSLAENDAIVVGSCRHDLLPHAGGGNSTTTSTNASATAAGAANTNTTSSSSTAMTGISMNSSSISTASSASVAAASTMTAASTTTMCATKKTMTALGPTTSATVVDVVDIMEDEEENEQQRLGNCPHGTPSRVPLISSGGGGGVGMGVNCGPDDTEKATRRSLINATAASFHRHTLQTFQRNGGVTGGSNGNGQKASFALRRNCLPAMHISSGHCYGGETTETSDDEEQQYMQCLRERLPLEHIDPVSGAAVVSSDDDDVDADGGDGDSVTCDEPQVPISVVLLILLCYICLGTVIFALWENWSLIDGAYFCFVTLATIGYGDFLPERTFHGPEVQLFACCAYLLLGLVLVAMSFSILETQLMWKCKRIAVRLKLAKD